MVYVDNFAGLSGVFIILLSFADILTWVRACLLGPRVCTTVDLCIFSKKFFGQVLVTHSLLLLLNLCSKYQFWTDIINSHVNYDLSI